MANKEPAYLPMAHRLGLLVHKPAEAAGPTIHFGTRR
uniref:Uncharacterized protein n=1 Tax=Arundo donax TaxID=35708 RepID=A0A0A9HDT2_ARUDO